MTEQLQYIYYDSCVHTSNWMKYLALVRSNIIKKEYDKAYVYEVLAEEALNKIMECSSKAVEIESDFEIRDAAWNKAAKAYEDFRGEKVEKIVD